MPEKITLHEMTPEELRIMVREIIQEEFEIVNEELQRVVGEDDLVSTGTACRILGVSAKVLKVLADERHFTIYHHIKDKRYSRGELLEYRNRYRRNKKRG